MHAQAAAMTADDAHTGIFDLTFRLDLIATELLRRLGDVKHSF